MSYVDEITKTTALAIVNGWKPTIEAAAKNKQCSIYIYHNDTISKTVESKILYLFGLNIKRIDETCRGKGSCDFGCTCNTKTGYIVSW